MKVSKFLPMILCLGVLAFTSCSDDDDGGGPTTPTLTKSQLLVAKNWTVTALTVEPAIDIDNNGTQETNLIPFIPACTLDDFFDYNSDGTYTGEEGPSKCDPNDPQVFVSGTWTWNSDETRLVTNSNGDTQEVLVTGLTSTTLTIDEVNVFENVTYTFTYTFE